MHLTRFYPWGIWFVSVLFFAYQFILRLTPGLIMSDIMQKFQVDATAFGFLSSMYYFGYSGMQIPVAMLLDRWGPRLVISVCAFVCCLATLAFVYANHWAFILLGRFLIGAGSAAGFLGVSKVISLWFPLNRYAKMIGYTFTLGLLGALYGGKPIAYLIEQWGWEKVLVFVSLLGFLIAFFVVLWVKQPPLSSLKKEEGYTLSNLKALLKNPVLIIIAFSNLLMVGSLEGFADVWGVTYLMKVYHLEKTEAAFTTSLIFVGMLFGGPLLAWVAEKLKAYYEVTAACGFVMALIFAVMLSFSGQLSSVVLAGMMFLTGILCCYQVLVFALGTHLVPAVLAGVTVAFLNCINMLGGSFFHGIIGYLMDLFWSGQFENNIKFYDATAYTKALWAIPVASLVGTMLLLAVSRKAKK
jgi:MFS family permease